MFPSTAARFERLRKIFPRQLVDGCVHRIMEALHYPHENLCTVREYRRALEQAGFVDIRIESLFESTVGPFISYCRRRLRALAREPIPGTLAFRILMRVYLALMPTSDYLLCTARKS